MLLHLYLIFIFAVTLSCGVDPASESTTEKSKIVVEDSNASETQGDQQNSESVTDTMSDIADDDDPADWEEGVDMEDVEESEDIMEWENTLDDSEGLDESDGLAWEESVQDQEPIHDGFALYSSYCEGCHGAIETSSKLGKSSDQISTAIENVGSMSHLSTLSEQEIIAISNSLSY